MVDVACFRVPVLHHTFVVSCGERAVCTYPVVTVSCQDARFIMKTGMGAHAESLQFPPANSGRAPGHRGQGEFLRALVARELQQWQQQQQPQPQQPQQQQPQQGQQQQQQHQQA
jgi:hypothetical protein